MMLAFEDELVHLKSITEEATILGTDRNVRTLDVVIRLLYGRLVSRTGATAKHGSQHARRKAILGAIANLGLEVIDCFLGVALGPLDRLDIVEDGKVNSMVLQQEKTGTSRTIWLAKGDEKRGRHTR